MAPITATADTTLQIGAGGDWWMQWWVDGQPVFDTLGEGHAGNGPTSITGRDHIFTIQLTKGPHVLAVAVFGYRQFLFAVTSPQQPPVGRNLQFAACRHSARTAAVLSPLGTVVGIAGPQPGSGAHQPALKRAGWPARPSDCRRKVTGSGKLPSSPYADWPRIAVPR